MDQFLYKTDIGDRDIAQGGPVGEESKLLFPAGDIYFEILDSRWSPFGNVTVVRREEQLTFFSNGTPLCNVPVPNIGFVEELVHYPLLLSPSPKNVLIVGGGFGGVIQEILKHPVE